MKFIGCIALLAALVTPSISHSDELAKRGIAQKVAESSGMVLMIESIPEQIQAQHIQRKTIAKNPEVEELVTRLLVESFRVAEAKEALYDSLSRNASIEELKAIVLWLESPLGKRFSLAEMKAAQPTAQADFMKYMAEIQANPPPQSRISLIQHLEKSSNQTESMLKVVELIMRGMFSGLNEALPDDKKTPAESFEKDVSDMRMQARQMIWEQVILMNHFTYREFTDAQIKRYANFFESDAGRKYVNLTVVAFADVFTGLFNSVVPRIREVASQIGKKEET